MLSIIWFIIIGFLAGLIARAVLPGADHMGFLATTAVGIVGSLIGGLLASKFKPSAPGSKFNTAGIVWSVIGAILLLIILRLLR